MNHYLSFEENKRRRFTIDQNRSLWYGLSQRILRTTEGWLGIIGIVIINKFYKASFARFVLGKVVHCLIMWFTHEPLIHSSWHRAVHMLALNQPKATQWRLLSAPASIAAISSTYLLICLRLQFFRRHFIGKTYSHSCAAITFSSRMFRNASGSWVWHY